MHDWEQGLPVGSLVLMIKPPLDLGEHRPSPTDEQQDNIDKGPRGFISRGPNRRGIPLQASVAPTTSFKVKGEVLP
jgi:hypothetical protein